MKRHDHGGHAKCIVSAMSSFYRTVSGKMICALLDVSLDCSYTVL